MRQNERVNHSNQLNPNNKAYWESRGWNQRPDDWKARIAAGDVANHSALKPTGSNRSLSNLNGFDQWFRKNMSKSICTTVDDDDD